MKTDLTITRSGLFSRYLPNTPAGENVWRELAAQTDGTGKVLAIHEASITAQLRAAGYTVSARKPRGPKMTADELLAALGV